MHEDLLQFIWQRGLYNNRNLRTTDGDEVIVDFPGSWNATSGGPDFKEARLRIGDAQWMGSVEVHLRSSEWNAHRHQHDPNYDNVVLHVVFEHDAEVCNSRGQSLLTCELRGRIAPRLLENYQRMMASRDVLPCASFLPQIHTLVWRGWLDRLLVERLSRKSDDIRLLLRMCQNDWFQVFWMMLGGYFGQNLNKQPLMELCRVVPIKTLIRYSGNPLQVEAFLLGAAGLLPVNSDDTYVQSLKHEYQFLSHKHGVKAIHQHWNFGGIRPGAFPTRRIVLLASLVRHLPELYQCLTEGDALLWTDIDWEVHPYWHDHYTFERQHDKAHKPKLGRTGLAVLQINVVAPFRFCFGQSHGDQRLMDRAVEELSDMEPEANTVMRLWKMHGIEPANAADSQALLELNTDYCKPKKCVLCSIGKAIMQQP